MKKTQILALLLCLMLTVQTGFAPGYATEPETEPTAQTPPAVTLPEMIQTDAPEVLYGPHSADGHYPILGSDKILEDASAAIVYDPGSDTLVYTWEPDAQIAPSSLTKLMTALLAIENGELTEEITVSYRVLETVPSGALVAPLKHEEVLTLEQLLYLMLVGSANDAAAVIANHVGGSQEQFVEMMNRRAAELGCTGTNFVNAHGVHEDGQVTTARDTVKILDKALEYPVFVEIFGTTSYTLAATNKSEARNFYTSNYMGSTALTDDYYDERVTGGRTGNTQEGYRNLAVTATVEGTTYIVVVLESRSEYADNGIMIRQGAFEDAAILLDMGFEQCATAQVLYENQSLQQLPVPNGTNDAVIGPRENVHCVLPKNLDPALLTTRIRLDRETLTAPVTEGISVGQCQVFYNGLCIADVELYTLNGARVSDTANQPSDPVQEPQEPGFDPGSLMTAFAVLGIICAVVLVLGGGLLLVRWFGSRSRQQKKTRSRRQDRRRSK